MKLDFLKKIKLSKAWLILLVAIIVGVLAALGARHYLTVRMAQMEDKISGSMVDTIVAKQALQKGDQLSKENVAVRRIPKEYSQSGAATPEQFDNLAGEHIAYDVEPGEMILWSMLEAKKVPTFSERVEIGRRAVTVPVDEINSISGMLEPGDSIDLIASLDQNGHKTTLSVLQAVKVIATGQRSADDPQGATKEYATVTLDTTLADAKNIILAREIGRITALLRNPEDTLDSSMSSDQVAKILNNMNKKSATTESIPQRKIPTQAPEVPVLYGKGGGALNAMALSQGSMDSGKNSESSEHDVPAAK